MSRKERRRGQGKRIIEAIVARHHGMPYSEVLARYELTPKAFHSGVLRLDRLVDSALPDQRSVLVAIQKSPKLQEELFQMKGDYLMQQFNSIRGDPGYTPQRKFVDGTLNNQKNIEAIVYYAMTSAKPRLKELDTVIVVALSLNNQEMRDTKRKALIDILQDLPENKVDYFREIGLKSVMSHLGKGKKDSPLAIMEIFDSARQRYTKDKSIFDLSEKHHIHPWDFSTHLYWKDPNKYEVTINNVKVALTHVELAVYYILTEHTPKDIGKLLKSGKRQLVVEGLNKLPYNLKDYLDGKGMESLMMHAFEGNMRGSPLAILQVFDKVYQTVSKDPYSLFNLSRTPHMHKWGDKFKTPNSYWDNPDNVEEAVYHMMTQHTPQEDIKALLKSHKREDAVKGILSLPKRLYNYFERIGLSGLIGRMLVLDVLKAFDRAYKKETGDLYSLFELTQTSHLHGWDYSDSVLRATNFKKGSIHILSEKNPKLFSPNREEAVAGLENLPDGLSHYLRYLKLDRMKSAPKNLKLAVVNIIDKVRKYRYDQVSLLDKSQSPYVELCKDGRVRHDA